MINLLRAIAMILIAAVMLVVIVPVLFAGEWISNWRKKK